MHHRIKRRKTNASGNAEDVDTGASGLMTVLTETNFVGSSSSSTEINTNASSSLMVSIGNCYEVFLSFRGPDTRHSFTDHLYHGLFKAGIHTFRDDDELCQGEDIRPELMAAITNSKILVPIFSVNYGTSSWCLDELVQIMERKNNNGQIVVPIFYKVKPAEVRYQTGRFGDAFHEHESHLRERSSFDPTTLEKWKQALLEVSNLKGYEADGAIVREENQQRPWHRSRLWDSEEALKMLKRNEGTDKIEVIDLSKGNSEGSGKVAKQDGDVYTAKQFKKLTNLRFLYMKGAHLSGDFEGSMEELKWLRWQKCPRNFEVNNFHVEELVVLELPYSKINEKWEGWSFFMMAEKLKYLDLSYCESLEDTDFLLAFKKLEVLILNWCKRLKRIDASIGDMEALLRLELGACFHLRELPEKIGKLKALQQLDLRHTTSLSALPNSIGSLENLEILDISYSGIEELPNGIGSLRKLRELHVYGCRNLKGIMVESMCNLSSL
ncbi:disease resistance protein RUN1-like [Eucalyptus grandis]|uniref:disease resistance protein RUN1-like n=1 Tax=Eucalyptus grandis TaxID=71139 RepID=UPI00192EBB8C|nr:disease resistance protein RUN1-like [Eucalyptus grandis]